MDNIWQDKAACAGRDAAMWFPDHYAINATRTARSVCQQCKARQECLDYAIEAGEQHGIWGGLAPVERDKVARENNKPVRKGLHTLAPCGTTAAYRRHLRRNEHVDDACMQANRDKNNEKSAQRRQRAREERNAA